MHVSAWLSSACWSTCQFGSSAGCILIQFKTLLLSCICRCICSRCRSFLLVSSEWTTFLSCTHAAIIASEVFQLNGIERICRPILTISSLLIHFQRVFQLGWSAHWFFIAPWWSELGNNPLWRLLILSMEKSNLRTIPTILKLKGHNVTRFF